jgi:cyclohexadieny/prephenate dehydrogenase
MMAKLFEKVAIVGIGHIGSSLARVIKRDALAERLVTLESNPEHRAKALELGIVDAATDDVGEVVRDADLVILATPIGTYPELAAQIAPHLKKGAIVSDVGSVKMAALRDIGPLLPDGVHFVPGHPIAGTEHSGPTAGFAELFQGRWCILTPPAGTNEAAIKKMVTLWEAAGSTVEIMEASYHDRVLAITSHLPHLIAYTIVGTATDLETTLQQEVVKFSASGFRDFTRIAASDPVMWRDIFLNNREAVLEVLQRFTEDLTALQRAIRWGEGDKLEELFRRTRAIRRSIIDAHQA